MVALLSFRQIVRFGIVSSVMVWIVYGLVESWFSIIFPWILKPDALYTLHWKFTVLLFFIYVIIGFCLGALLGFGLFIAVRYIAYFKKFRPSIFLQSLSTLTLVLVFDVCLIVNCLIYSQRSLKLSELPPLSISLLFMFGLVSSSCSNDSFMRLRFITNPWTISVVLLGLPWLHHVFFSKHPRVVNALEALAYTSVIFLISFFINKILHSRRNIKSAQKTLASSGRYIIFLVFFVLILNGLIFILKQAPPKGISNLDLTFQESDYPNIILITMDTVRADHLSLYGYERDTTPNLRKFSEEAALYNQAIASGPDTLPTHASIFTGLYARQHGAHFYPWYGYPDGRPLGEKFQTLAEILSEKGYLTLGVTANTMFFSPFYCLDQGFQYHDNRIHIRIIKNTWHFFIRECISNIMISFAPRDTFDRMFCRAEKINKEAFKLLNRIKGKEKPFLLFLNYMDAHTPYIPPSPFDRFYPGKDETFTLAHYASLSLELHNLEREINKVERNHLLSQYDGAIAYIDFHIGKLITQLKKLDLYENSLIIITSDHGESFGRRGLIGHGVSVYQDQVHIPLIIKYPNSREKSVIDKVVSVVDLMPTILCILGEKIPENLHGQSLVRLKKKESRSIISETYPRMWKIGHLSRFDRIEYAMYSGLYKFISSTSGKKELFCLEMDPYEKDNIYKPDDDFSKTFEKKMNQWLKTNLYEFDSSVKAKPDKETIDRLKSLGYIK